MTAIGTGEAGSTCSAEFFFPNDPGYRDTARMCVQLWPDLRPTFS